MRPHFSFNMIILQQDVDDDCQELQQPRHETEAVDDAMDEQLHQPQHENETVDDAVDEQLRKYCQELVVVSVTKSK